MKKCLILSLVLFVAFSSKAQTMKWHYNLKDVSFGQTVAKDIDGDGKLELIFSTYWNDSNVYCLNSEDGSLKWKHLQKGFGGGCNDAGPVIFDPFLNGNYKVVIPGSCMDTTFCVDADSGYVQWKTITGGGDSPPSSADIDGDGIPEIIHGTFYGNVKCLNGQTGTIKWSQLVDTNAAIESEATLIKNTGELDFAVATWDYTYDSNRIVCYKASDHSIKWRQNAHNLIYHGPATGDLFKNGQQEVVIGDYDGYLYCIRSSDGTLLWKDSVSKLLPYHYIGAPVTLADIDNDGYLDIIYMDGYMVRAVNRNDSTLWTYTPPGDYTNFRGAVVADVNNDNIKDVTFCTNYGTVISLDGNTGAVIRTFDLLNYAHTILGDTSSIFEVDNAPIIADFDGDGILDLFIIGGKGRSDSTSRNDYGYAFCLSWGVGNGPAWTMFRHDERRTGCLCDSNGLPLSLPSDNLMVQNNRFRIVPNPVSDALTITLDEPFDQNITITITDITGNRIMPVFEQHCNQGFNSFTIDKQLIMQLANGIYLININGSTFHATEKVTVLH